MKLLLLFFLLFLRGDEGPGEKQPIGIINTTKYCTGRLTTSGAAVKPGHVALSRDIIRTHKLKFGDLIYVEDESLPYVFMDTMPPHWRRHADFYQENCRGAVVYGVQKRMTWFVKKTN